MPAAEPKELILASASPQRHALLSRLGVPFRVVVSPRTEPANMPPATRPRAWACALAYHKARAVVDLLRTPSGSAPRGAVVLGADTVVHCDGQLLGKPQDLADARRMLMLQAGRDCEVITGVALLAVGAGGRVERAGSESAPAAALEAATARPSGDLAARRRIFAVSTLVRLRDDRIAMESYLASGDWSGKAGAYGIQSLDDRMVESVRGSFTNVIGLPLAEVAKALREEGFAAVVPAEAGVP